MTKSFVSLGLFIIDEFLFLDEDGNTTQRSLEPQIGGGGTYAAIGCRIWSSPQDVSMIVDRGYDFDPKIQETLDSYGPMWYWRDQKDKSTTRARNIYRGEHRGFEYLGSRIRLNPRDLKGSPLERPSHLHFICSPKRAKEIMVAIDEFEGWNPFIIYEPIPDSCIPENLRDLKDILPRINVLSPNADEALSLLGIPRPVTKEKIEDACAALLEDCESVIIRSGALGAYTQTRAKPFGQWVDAFFLEKDAERVKDVTGAGNGFLGGLSAGLRKTDGDIYNATFYASVSASFMIEQYGLPKCSTLSSSEETWNDDSPQRRLDALIARHSN